MGLAIYRPTVTVVGSTDLTMSYGTAFPVLDALQSKELQDIMDSNNGDTLAESYRGGEPIIEAAGRVCYDSMGRPSAATAGFDKYLESLINKQHLSVFEHAQVSFMVKGVSRGCLCEITRHRHFSFSVRSTRYCDERNARCVIPPDIIGTTLEEHVLDQFRSAVRHYVELQCLMKTGRHDGDRTEWSRKEINGIARTVLPHSLETQFVISANFTAWREMLRKRLHPSAETEIRRLARYFMAGLLQVSNISFVDIYRELSTEDQLEIETLITQNEVRA